MGSEGGGARRRFTKLNDELRNGVTMVDEAKRSERVRDDRIQGVAREQMRPRPKETDFDKVLEKSRLASQLAPQQQTQSKTVTEEAIREAAKRQDREGDERKKDDDGESNRDTRQKGEGTEAKVADQKVIAKGRLKQQSGGGGQDHGGADAQTGRRQMARLLARAQVKSVPLDLQDKFAARLREATMGAGAAHQVNLPQQVLNKIVQYVRVGINRMGEKEIQMDLHERIFRGLKLRVIARDGKVGIHFRAADARGRKVFERNRDAIRDALTKKGIAVDEIVVS